MIDSCSFGCLVINGKKYNSDLVIYPDGRVKDSWRRRSGHRLSLDDMEDLIEAEPEVIIAGTGVSGLMRPEKELEKTLRQRGIVFIALPNQKAVEYYNDLVQTKRVAAGFHLTC